MYARTCQSCLRVQAAKDPKTYKDEKSEAWRSVKCRKCGSEDLDYGSEGFHLKDGKIVRKEVNEDEDE